MNVTQEVVTDLLPVYFANEASVDTKALVEDYFRQFPDFERMARDASEPLETLRAATPIGAGAEREKRDLEIVRWRSQWRKVLLGVCLCFTLVPVSFYSNGHIVSPMVRTAPWDAAFCWSLALFFWALFFGRLSRRAAALAGVIFFALIPIPFVWHSISAGQPVGQLAFMVWMCAAVVWIGNFMGGRSQSCGT